MLRRFTASVGLAAVLVVGCGGGGGGDKPDTSTPAATCTAYSSAFCNKAHACGAAGYTPACSTQVQTALDCPHFACAAGRTFDSAAASQCIDAINALSCTDAANGLLNGVTPDVCGRVCR